MSLATLTRKEKLELLDLITERARRHLIDFTLYTKPDYKAGWFQKRLAKQLDKFLQDVVDEKSPRLIVMAPPRSGKSELVSRRFPAYALGRYPDLSFIATSYASDLASGMNRDVQRVIDNEDYAELFPDTRLWGANIRTVADGSYLRNSDIFEIVDHKGVYKSAGVGAGVTGRGGHCLPAGTEVTTDQGQINIEELVGTTSSCKVLSFSKEGDLEWKRVEHKCSRQADGLFRITTTSGRVVEATGDHEFWCGGRYTRADLLTPGDSLLLLVQEDIHQAQLVDAEESASWVPGSLLQSGLLIGTSRDQELACVSGLQQQGSQTIGLLCGSQIIAQEEATRSVTDLPTQVIHLRDLWDSIPATGSAHRGRSDGVLFEELCGRGSVTADSGQWKSTLERWDGQDSNAAQAHSRVATDQASHREAGSLDVPCVLDTGTVGGPSRGSRSVQQQLGQPGDTLPRASSSVSHVERPTCYDTVAKVEWMAGAVQVYDIQVEDNHNFFANGILTHNCLIVDDPIKDAAEAHSETVRNGIWDWFTSTLYTRCAPGGGILVIMTRWHQDDLVGHLLEQAKLDGEQWTVFNFPAIAEADEYDEDGQLLRPEGAALHPERFDLTALERIKKAVGSKVWASLYQQRPSAAEGNIFKRENWKYWRCPGKLISEYDAKERKQLFHEMGITSVIQRWDTALGGKKTNDATACVTMGVAKSRYYVLNVWKDKIQFPDVARVVKQQYDKWTPTKVFIEGGGSASGKATVQTMKRETRIPLYETITSTDKVLRADLMSPNQESGLCYLPEGEAWVGDFVDQCAGFPDIKNDDDVDAFIGALEEAAGTPGPLQITDELLRMVGALP